MYRRPGRDRRHRSCSKLRIRIQPEVRLLRMGQRRIPSLIDKNKDKLIQSATGEKPEELSPNKETCTHSGAGF